jgi:DNA helicase TIP49 (TBP-interacting protein)
VLNTNTGVWQQSSHGLANDLIVRNIAFKQNMYKDANIKKYIFLATNKGIYMSSDLGENWTMTIAGNYVTIY